MTKLATGDLAPDFTLINDSQIEVSLKNFAGKKVVLYFYPKAMTPGCTKQACDFTESHQVFQNQGYEIIGISPDTPERLAKFREKENINYTLLSDPNHEVMRAYGAFGEKKLYGKVLEGVIRSTFVLAVAENGEATVIEARLNVKATGHVAKLIRELGL